MIISTVRCSILYLFTCSDGVLVNTTSRSEKQTKKVKQSGLRRGMQNLANSRQRFEIPDFTGVLSLQNLVIKTYPLDEWQTNLICTQPKKIQVRREISAVFIDSHYKSSSPVEAGNFSKGWLSYTQSIKCGQKH